MTILFTNIMNIEIVIQNNQLTDSGIANMLEAIADQIRGGSSWGSVRCDELNDDPTWSLNEE